MPPEMNIFTTRQKSRDGVRIRLNLCLILTRTTFLLTKMANLEFVLETTISMHYIAEDIPREVNGKIWAALIAPRPLALISTQSATRRAEYRAV